MEQGEPFKKGREKYNEYTPEERAMIGKYATENGPARTIHHFSDRKLPETTARRLKSKYLLVMKSQIKESKVDGTVPQVSSLSKKPQGRPLLLGQELSPGLHQCHEESGRSYQHCNCDSSCKWDRSCKKSSFTHTAWWSYRHHQSMGKISAQSDGLCKKKMLKCWKMSVARFEEVQEEFLEDIKV